MSEQSERPLTISAQGPGSLPIYSSVQNYVQIVFVRCLTQSQLSFAKAPQKVHLQNLLSNRTVAVISDAPLQGLSARLQACTLHPQVWYLYCQKWQLSTEDQRRGMVIPGLVFIANADSILSCQLLTCEAEVLRFEKDLVT